jgi:hypothetical protein
MKTNWERLKVSSPKWSEIVAGNKNRVGEVMPSNSDDYEMLVSRSAGNQEVANIVKRKYQNGGNTGLQSLRILVEETLHVN